MKNRIFLIVSLATVGTALIVAHSSSDPDAVRQKVVSKEREELEAVKRGDSATFAGLIAEDAVFVDPRGTAGKAEVVQNTAEFKLLEYSMDDIRFVPVSPKSGLVAYRLTEKGVSHGRDFSGQVHASALWTEREVEWVCIFSQETPARQPEPARQHA